MNRRKAIQQTAFLLGGTLSASVIAGVMSGCQPTGEPDWIPQFLTKEQAATISEIAETILPESDTLGAKSLHLTEFVDIMLKDCHKGEEQLQFPKELAKFEEICQSTIGKSFVNATPEERQSFLIEHEQNVLVNQHETGEKAFITKLKELVIVGYFTSEYAITELMNFNPIPQKFEGCVETPQQIQVGIEGRSV